VAGDQEAVLKVPSSGPASVTIFTTFFLAFSLLSLGDLEKVEKSSKIQFESTHKITFFGLNTENYRNIRKFFRTFP
jgi:hypothetical protein